jgi:histidinol phosphatase-like enzyme
MLEAALAAWPTDRANSFLIGDRPGDLQAAESAGITARLADPEGPLTAVEEVLATCHDDSQPVSSQR